ncbi:phosphatidylethanolamine-binding protein [Aspergillus aurantiobrunneus]
MVDPTTPNGSISTLHALETNLHLDVELTTGEDQLYSKLHGDPQNAPLAPYMGPNPPPGSPDHKYVQLLFKQPEEDFSIPGKYAHFLPQIPTSRLGFPLEQFVNETGLGEPVAGLYFEEGPRQVKFRKF